MKNKAFVITIVICLAIIVGVIAYSNLQKRDIKSFAIIMTSDLQSQIAPFEMNIDGEKVMVGGMARITSAARKAREGADYYTFLSSGDDLMAPLFNVFAGVPEMVTMTRAGYMGATPGNHEFDKGADAYAEAIKSAGFQIISANMDFDNEYLDKRIRDSYVWAPGEFNIHVFGLMTPDFERLTKGAGVSIDRDFVKVAKEQVAIAKKEKRDMIIAITHLGYDLDVKLAEAVPEIDLIVGGHSHEFAYDSVGKTIIIQAGAGGSHLGVLRFDFDGKAISNHRWETVLLDSTVGADAKIDSIVNFYASAMQESLGQVIGKSAVELDARKSTVRGGEAAIGNFIADSWLDWIDGADIALVNGGSIRGDRVYPAGDLTYYDAISIIPFRNEIFEAKMTGAQIAHALEMSASAIRFNDDYCADTCRVAYGGFLQVAGITFEIDISQRPFEAIYDGRSVSAIVDSGSRVSNVRTKTNGEWGAIDPTAEYTVLISSWLASGGDGYYIFADEVKDKKSTTVYDTDILVEYIKKNSPISPRTDTRIRIMK